MFETRRPRSNLASALQMADLIYHSSVRSIRNTHGNAGESRKADFGQVYGGGLRKLLPERDVECRLGTHRQPVGIG